MRISRRDFLKYCSVAAGALGLSATDLLNVEKALAVNGALPVIWLNGQACTGCTVSLANSVYYTTLQDLTLFGLPADSIDLMNIETLSASMGDQFLPARPAGSFVLAVEGAIPTKDHGYCEITNTYPGWNHTTPVTIYDAVSYYGATAAAILSIGTCASFGGIPAGKGNPTGAKGVLGAFPAFESKILNIPGCPPNPNWIVGSIAYMLANSYALPAYDNIRRPNLYYGNMGRLCTRCPRVDGARKGDMSAATQGLFIGGGKGRPYDDIGNPTKRSYCLRRIGCKGPKTQSDCSFRQWNSTSYRTTGVNWCVGAGAPCQGCTQADFPDKQSPFVNIL